MLDFKMLQSHFFRFPWSDQQNLAWTGKIFSAVLILTFYPAIRAVSVGSYVPFCLVCEVSVGKVKTSMNR